MRPPGRLLRRGLVVGLLMVAVSGTVQLRPAEATHPCRIDITGHHGWYLCETEPAYVRYDNRLHVFVVGLDNAVWYAWERWRGGPWSTWHTLGGIALDSPHASVDNFAGPSELRVKVFGLHLRFYCKTYSPPLGWGPWYGCPP